MVHLFTQGGHYIALDSASGAVHVLTELSYKVLQYLKPPLSPRCPTSLRYNLAKFSADDVTAAYEELYELYKEGMLFSEDVKIANVTPDAKYIPIKSMCLHIAHDCNMRCKYCFADTGDFHRERSLMSLEVAKKAIDFLLEKSGPIKNLELDFFGGEPLLNFDVVKETVKYGREQEKKLGKNIRFTITTNGSLLDDESIDFINENMSNVVLSIDGRKEVNDRIRTYLDGSGTYDDILPKYQKLVEKRTNGTYYVRGTYTRENLDFAKDVISLAEAGFDQISVEPVVLSDDDPLSIRREDLPRIFEEYETLTEEMIKRNKEGNAFNFFHFMVDLDAGPCVYKRMKGCGSGSEYVSVTPEGDVYPCHQFVEHTEYKLGNIFDGNLDDARRTEFAGCNICTNPECEKCWAKYFCGGGCAANNYKFAHDIKVPYEIACELERKRVECALTIKAAMAEDEE